MASYEYSLKTTHVALGVILLVLTVGFRAYHRHVPADDSLRGALRERILQGYRGRNAMDAAKIAAEMRVGAPRGDVGAVERDVEFRSISAHARVVARLGATTTWIRAAITVDGSTPPDGRTVRYFRMYQSALSGAQSGLADSDSYVYYWTMIQ